MGYHSGYRRWRLTMLLAGVLLIVFLLLGLWLWIRGPQPAEPGPDLSTLAPVTPEPEEEPLTPPIYPDFETAWSLQDRATLEEYLFSIEPGAYVYDSDLDMEAFLNMDFAGSVSGAEPKVLIFHTHSQEAFADSRPDTEDDTIVGVGKTLADILAEDYGVSVVHDVGRYDMADGYEQRAGSYERMEPAVAALLEKYPSIEVVIDLHRDAVPEEVRLLAALDGKPTARIMLVNGITRLDNNGEPEDITSLPNPYVQQNLGLSTQLQLTANSLYPGLMRRIYIKPYRYSLHLKPKSILVEVGASNNTLEEAQNAMKPLAEIIMNVLG